MDFNGNQDSAGNRPRRRPVAEGSGDTGVRRRRPASAEYQRRTGPGARPRPSAGEGSRVRRVARPSGQTDQSADGEAYGAPRRPAATNRRPAPDSRVNIQGRPAGERPSSAAPRRAPDGENAERKSGEDIVSRPARRRRPAQSEAAGEGVGLRRRPADRQESPVKKTGRKSSGKDSGGGRNPKSANKKKRTIILFAVELVAIVLLLGFIFFVRTAEKVEKIRIDEEAITVEMNETISTNETMKGYRNIALFGVDSREGSLGKGTRSDTIIIASINQDTGDVKLMSVFRDTYLNLGNDSYNKCNAAYAKGGPEQALIMLNKNLDMNITDYITVGFDGLIEVIDALGGVEIEVTQPEIEHLNNYQISMVGVTSDGEHFTATAGRDYTPVTSPGRQTLNGLQATAYCRIRYIGNDFQRAQRQRDVITAISEKAKKSQVSVLKDVANGVMDNISTSMDVREILGVMTDVGKYSIVDNDGFPFEEYRATNTVSGKGSCVIPVDLKKNVVELHRFLFDEQDYQVSPEVEKYSEKVSSDTGFR